MVPENGVKKNATKLFMALSCILPNVSCSMYGFKCHHFLSCFIFLLFFIFYLLSVQDLWDIFLSLLVGVVDADCGMIFNFTQYIEQLFYSHKITTTNL